jgi:hypothetical protein
MTRERANQANNRQGGGVYERVARRVVQESPLALAPTSLPSMRATAGAAPRAHDPAATRIEVGSVVGGRYEIVEFVAEGAFGAVYRALDIDVAGHVVALKLMHRPAQSGAEHARFLREVELIAAVSHPSVVSFKQHGLHRGRLYIVMPWYEGETLARRLETRGPLSREEALGIFKRLAAALAAMHERGIRHQDVKPDNILLARFGAGQEDFPVLLDLGVGAFDDEHLPAFTAHYVAPEMARAHLALCAGEEPSPVDGRADVFALALTLVDALAPGARELSSAAGSAAVLARRAEQGVTLPASRELADILPALTRWLSVDPQGRPSARELVEELSVLTRREEQRRERRRLALRFGPVLCLILAVAGGLAFQLRSERVRSRSKDVRIEQQAAEIDALSGEQRERARQVEQVQRENAALEARLAREQARKQSLERSLESEQRAGRELRRGLESAGERAVALEAELRGLEQELTMLRSERESIGEELLRTQGARRSLNLEAERARAEQQRLSGELSALVAERALLIERIRALEQSESSLAGELARLRAEAYHSAP